MDSAGEFFCEDKMIEWMALLTFSHKSAKAVGHETLPLASITYRIVRFGREH